jgi:hypothetical protein
MKQSPSVEHFPWVDEPWCSGIVVVDVVVYLSSSVLGGTKNQINTKRNVITIRPNTIFVNFINNRIVLKI